ncbi:MAG: DUF423 domain-containing protein [Pseudorhodoplanes sp.]
MLQVLVGIAALLGCAGIMLAATGAHSKPGSGLDSAGHMLLFHAPAVIAACCAIASGLVSRPIAITACIALLIGVGLFSGDLALRVYAGQRLFPMAAPAGGIVMMAGWALLGLAAFLALR